jgi:hypothetical protein
MILSCCLVPSHKHAVKWDTLCLLLEIPYKPCVPQVSKIPAVKVDRTRKLANDLNLTVVVKVNVRVQHWLISAN